MSTETVKSRAITNRDASPRVFNNSSDAAGSVRSFCGSCEAAAGVDIGSKYIFGSLPSNARMESLKIYSDDIGTGTLADIGLYKSTQDNGSVVDADFFASALDVHSGALNGTDILYESGVIDVGNGHKMLWELLGLSADPGIMYDVVATTTAAVDVGGTMHVKCQYVI